MLEDASGIANGEPALAPFSSLLSFGGGDDGAIYDHLGKSFVFPNPPKKKFKFEHHRSRTKFKAEDVTKLGGC